ncbi:uncharacterized protein LOC135367253 [Ornithodoros turicata]|uniref:uncharacterized protein LOC135367253 n=1 Tax=Ornithodoros turicata TaxID=34597 RepID=UPI003138F8C0
MVKRTVAILSALLIISFASGRVISDEAGGNLTSSESDDQEPTIDRKAIGVVIENVGRVLQNDSAIKGVNSTTMTTLKNWLLHELTVNGTVLDGTDHALMGNTLELFGYLLQDDEQEIIEIDTDNDFLSILLSLGDLAAEVARNETLAA